MENPFPLEISPKQDGIEKLQLMANVPADFKYTAEEWNKVIAALNWLYENYVMPIQTFVYPMAISPYGEDLETGETNSIAAPFNGQCTGYFLNVEEAPTGSAILTHLKKNGDTVTIEPARIPANEKNSLGSGNSPVLPMILNMVRGDIFTPNVTQVGNTTPGKTLTIYFFFVRTS